MHTLQTYSIPWWGRFKVQVLEVFFALKGEPGFPCFSPLCSKTPHSSCVGLAATAAPEQEETDYG